MKFEEATHIVKKLKSEPTNDELLQLYSLYKQATIGDCNTTQPSIFDPVGKAKWNAWNSHKGTSVNSAQKKYIDVAQKLVSKYGTH
jgi:diazepam-binding inhibitor (GABA receptor modulating acyl-CoA-binding protein)